MEIEGWVPVFPTEDPEKVRSGIERLFPGSIISMGKERIDFTTDSLDELGLLLEEQRIRDTAVMVLRRNLIEDSTHFYLNKQAALFGRVNFTEGNSSLGDIQVKVMSGALAIMESTTPQMT